MKRDKRSFLGMFRQIWMTEDEAVFSREEESGELEGVYEGSGAHGPVWRLMNVLAD